MVRIVILPPDSSFSVPFHQYMVGGGTPSAAQSKMTESPSSTIASIGSMMNLGSAGRDQTSTDRGIDLIHEELLSKFYEFINYY